MSPFRTSTGFLVLAFAIQLAGLPGQLAIPAEKNKLAQTKTEQSSALSKIESEDREFIKRYVALPPQEQVEIWSKAASNTKYLPSIVEWRMQTEMEQVLVLEGVDAVPYIAKLLVAGSTGRRLRVLKMLCDMDRFVPDEKIPLEAARNSIYVGALQKGGRVNPFIPVDGHRIGNEGLGAILAIANQSENQLTQFYARLWTGQVRKDLENLSFEEQVRRWREAVIKSRIVIKEAEFPELSSTYKLLEVIWMERMPESIPKLTELLERDKDPYVRTELIHVFARADGCSVRLRKLESGRAAIEAVRRALEHGSLVLGYRSEKQRSDGLDLLLANFNKDQVRIESVVSVGVIRPGA